MEGEIGWEDGLLELAEIRPGEGLEGDGSREEGLEEVGSEECAVGEDVVGFGIG